MTINTWKHNGYKVIISIVFILSFTFHSDRRVLCYGVTEFEFSLPILYIGLLAYKINNRREFTIEITEFFKYISGQ